jgi:hypothetical protein
LNEEREQGKTQKIRSNLSRENKMLSYPSKRIKKILGPIKEDRTTSQLQTNSAIPPVSGFLDTFKQGAKYQCLKLSPFISRPRGNMSNFRTTKPMLRRMGEHQELVTSWGMAII